MEQGYLAQIQALIDQKWKENPEEMKRVMAEIEAKEKAKKEKPKVETPKGVSFDPQLLTQELIKELDKEDWDDVDMSKVQDLIERGADVGAKSDEGHTPLHLAAARNDLELAKLLIDRGADVNVEDEDGWTPLHLASYKDNIEIVKLLLDAGADVEAKDNHGMTPFDLAESDEMEDLLE